MDRGIIKWQPFNSCFNSTLVLEDIKNSKRHLAFPTLSEDQISFLESQIKEAYNLKLNIWLSYYYDGEIKNIEGQINYIDNREKSLSINRKIIYLKQILKIKEI